MSYARHIARQQAQKSKIPQQAQKPKTLSTGEYLAVVFKKHYAVFQLRNEHSYAQPFPSEFGLLELLTTYSFQFDFQEFMKTNIQTKPDVKFKIFTDYYVAINFCSRNREK